MSRQVVNLKLCAQFLNYFYNCKKVSKSISSNDESFIGFKVTRAKKLSIVDVLMW